nr:hypothetical protein [Tanacetum cinerariifolium]
MIGWLSNVETDKMIHTIETDIMRLVDEIKSFGKSSDEFDKEAGSSDGLQPKRVDLGCVHAVNELHAHEIRVVPKVLTIDKLIHTVKTDIVKLMIEIKNFGISLDEFDKETESSDGLQPKQVDLSCVHTLNELHLHEIRVVLMFNQGDDPIDAINHMMSFLSVVVTSRFPTTNN